MYADRIINFGEKFRDRLEASLLNAALAYVRHNEEMLSLEILCDHLVEYHCPISSEEYLELESLTHEMGICLDRPPFKYLRSNIVCR